MSSVRLMLKDQQWERIQPHLRRRGWKESAGTRDYIAALRRTSIRLFEVSDIMPGEGMALRDLLHGGDPVRVWEKSGSRGVRQWDRIATPQRIHAWIGRMSGAETPPMRASA